MNIRETIIIDFDKKEADILNDTSTVLTKLIEKMDSKDKKIISDSDGFGYGREDVARAEEIISFLNSDGQFTLD